MSITWRVMTALYRRSDHAIRRHRCDTGVAMGDFSQSGVITTLHNLADRPVAELEADLRTWSARRPMSLAIPALHAELEGPGLRGIVGELSQVTYLDEIIIGLDRTDAAGFADARRFFEALPERHRVMWHDGPRLRSIDEDLAKQGLAPLGAGKGRNVWYLLGYFLASGRGAVVGLHDADIVTYSRNMLARLFYPVVHPTFGYVFSKGYYYRAGAADGVWQMNGRVTRLLVTPLISALRQTLGHSGYLDYLASFRYPLAGEYAMHADVARGLGVPFDWGLEVGVLSEVHRNYTGRRICQVDLADAYDHKHREISADDPGSGLHRMAIDITKAIYRRLAVGGEVFTDSVFRTIEASFHRHALDLVDQYHHDAEMNGFAVDRHGEEELVAVFARAVATAGQHYRSRPAELPHIPSWSLVLDAMPEVFERLVEAVEADNA